MDDTYRRCCKDVGHRACGICAQIWASPAQTQRRGGCPSSILVPSSLSRACPQYREDPQHVFFLWFSFNVPSSNTPNVLRSQFAQLDSSLRLKLFQTPTGHEEKECLSPNLCFQEKRVGVIKGWRSVCWPNFHGNSPEKMPGLGCVRLTRLHRFLHPSLRKSNSVSPKSG